MTAGNEIQLRPADSFMPVLSIEQAVQRYEAVVEFTRKVMREGRDFGTIPGTEKKRKDNQGNALPDSSNNTLLKPGAEKLCTLFGLAPDFQEWRVLEDWDKGIFYYAFRCVLRRNGQEIAAAIGSANSREKKYRRESRTCPSCDRAAITKSKFPPRGSPKGTPGGWYCNPKNGGCGTDFQHDDPAIVNQTAVTDPLAAADQVNTLQKMAQKRALVAVTLIATNASEFFTQDIEDGDPPDNGPPQNRSPEQNEENDSDTLHVNEDGTPDLSHAPTFEAEWRASARSRSLDEKNAWSFFGAILNKVKKSFNETAVEWRASTLGRLTNGEFDDAIKKIVNKPQTAPPSQKQDAAPAGAESGDKPAAAPEPVPMITAELVAGAWADFISTAWDFAFAAGLRNVTLLKSGLEKHAAMLGMKGKEDAIAAADRVTALKAIANGAFDFMTGEIKQLQPAGKVA